MPASAADCRSRCAARCGATGSRWRSGRRRRPGRTSRGDVWLVPVLRSRAIPIQGGENGGRIATYVNVVRGLQRLGSWTGQPARFDVPGIQAEIGDADSWVVLLQAAADGRPGRIIGAAKGPGL